MKKIAQVIFSKKLIKYALIIVVLSSLAGLSVNYIANSSTSFVNVSTNQLDVHIEDKKTLAGVAGAQVEIIDEELPPFLSTSDSNGVAVFFVTPSYTKRNLRLVVTATGYEHFEKNIQLLQQDLIYSVQLTPEDSLARTTTLTPSPSKIPTNTSTPTSTDMPTSTATHTMTPTQSPILTQTVISTPVTSTLTTTPSPTFSPAPTVTTTPSPTSSRTPVPISTVSDYPVPVLISPENDTIVSGLVTFEWQWTGPELSENRGFEVQVGVDEEFGGDNIAYGIYDVREWKQIVEQTSDNSFAATVHIDSSYAVRLFGSDRYFWTVSIVQIQPYERIGATALPHSIEVRIHASNNGGGDSAPAPTPGLGGLP